MHVYILGAGGIGGYYGARLQAAGTAVTFIARGDHLQALQDAGLVVEHPDFHFSAPVQSCTLEALVAGPPAADGDVLVLCTKAMATAAMADTLAPWLADSGACVLSLQNGVDNEPLLAAALGGDRVIGGLSRRLGGHVIAPGRIAATGPCDTLIGAWPNAASKAPHRDAVMQALADAMAAAGLATEVCQDIRRELWRKLILNNGVNPLSAILRMDTRRIARDPLLGPVVLAMMRETAAAAAADDVSLGDADAEAMYRLICDFDAIKTSMLVDLEHGRALELEAIPGAVLNRAAALGISAPHTQSVYAILKNLVHG